MSAPRVLFFADAGARVGGGHVMRCLTLAGALADRGATCAFIATAAASPILDAFGDPRVIRIAALDEGARWRPDILVVDHYGLGVDHEAALKSASSRLVAIDDLARPHAADLVVDPSFGRTASDYPGQARGGVLTGPEYALVRPEFATLREQAMARSAAPLRRCLVSLGLTDADGVIARIVEALLTRAGGEIALDVAIGSGAASLPALRELGDRGRITLHVDTRDMAAVAADTGMAVGAGGSSVWERATLGLPSIVLALAENQREMAQKLQNAGLAMTLDVTSPRFETQLTDAWRRVTGNPELRRELSARAAAACDGQGAGRVADAVLALAAG